MRYRGFLCLVIFIISAISGVSSSTEHAYFFLLKEEGGELQIERQTFQEGEEKTFSQDEYITFVLPVSVGMSGDVVQLSQDLNDFTVKFTGGEFHLIVKFYTGTERIFPPVKLQDLENYDVRVNVTSYSGTAKAFAIRQWFDYWEDDGPVIDMFGGAIPLQKGDYSITTETNLHIDLPNVYGEVPLMYHDGLLYATGKLPNGEEASFVVDFGAGGTLISKSFLPPGSSIEEVKAIEYSKEGQRVQKGTMGGAGGEVASFLGNAELSELKIGSMTFSDVTVRVVDEELKFGDKTAAGIMGSELLQRAEVVSFDYGEDAVLKMAPEPLDKDKEAIEIPFSMVAKHIFVDGKIGNSAVTFMFDTGARGTIITREIATQAGLDLLQDSGRKFKGMDGNPIPSEISEPTQLYLNGYPFEDVSFFVADLAVLKGMGLSEDGGLLGNNFLPRFDRIELDFENKVIRFFGG